MKGMQKKTMRLQLLLTEITRVNHFADGLASCDLLVTSSESCARVLHSDTAEVPRCVSVARALLLQRCRRVECRRTHLISCGVSLRTRSC
jgi:hypothetical protein